MDSFNPTTKTQAALTAALQAATTAGNPQIMPAHLLMALLTQNDGIAAPLLEAVGVEPATIRTETQRLLDRLPSASGASSQPQLSRESIAAITAAQNLATEMDDEYVSTEHLMVGLATGDSDVGQTAHRPRRIAAGAARGVRQGARQCPRHQRRPRGQLPGAGEVLHRPDRARPRRQARPGHRARQRDSPRRAGAVPAHQEQPGADRRARRRQDRDRRGPGPAHRGGRRAGEPARQDRRLARPRFDGRGIEVPRRVRGAAEGRARRHQELGGPDHHVHRRAAHHRRRGRDRRSRRWTRAT